MSELENAGLTTPHTEFQDTFSREIWESTYKYHEDETVDNTMRRVANAVASVEDSDEKIEIWANRFYDMLSGFKSTAGGRIYANAGTDYAGTTMLNCFVSPRADYDIDSLGEIIKDISNQAQTLKSEGGWGQNFSWIRPRGAFIHGIGVDSPGAVKYMEIYDKVSDVITSGSGKKSKHKKGKAKIRKGAQMSVLDVWHPDVEEFIRAKQTPGRLSKFNISVNCTDEFMEKVIKVITLTKEIDDLKQRIDESKDDTAKMFSVVDDTEDFVQRLKEADQWELRFPDTTHPKYKEEWDGDLAKWELKGYQTNVYKSISAIGLWNMIMESTYNRAEPGVLFLDRANYFSPSSYYEKIVSTNPSLTAGTLVHTKDGIFPIETLENKEFYVKTPEGGWAEAYCRLTGTDKEIMELNIGNHKTIKCTKEHKWPVYDSRMDRYYKVPASELKKDDLIPMNRNEDIGVYGDMSLTFDEGFFVGYFIGDGWLSKRSDGSGYSGGITFGTHEYEMAEKLVSFVNTLKEDESTLSTRRDNEICFQFTSKKFVEEILMERYKIVPGEKDIPSSVWTSNDDYIKGFVNGLLSADGHVSLDTSNRKITLITSREMLAKNFVKLISFAGVNGKISHTTTSASFPNKKNYDKEYERWQVDIAGNSIINFCNVFSIMSKQERLDILLESAKKIRNHRSSEFITIRDIKEAGTAKSVWDITVNHHQHVFSIEHCYTSNCGEQVLSPGNVCNLGSINLTQFINADHTGFDLDKLKKYVRYLNRFLDNINTLSNAPLQEYVDSMRQKRRVGIGVLGWGSALFMLKTRFASARADELREEVMSTIAREAYMSSIDLAEEKGMFEYCIPEKHAEGHFIQSLSLPDEYMDKLLKTGIRNSSLLSIQPTGNTSIFANIVSGGLEPIFMPEYVRTVIVNHMPDAIADVCPKWYEGEWFETEMFKFDKEGDEEILKGEHDGVVYKIDKNRGLTKEVLVQDYGVRWLAERGEWDPDADWAVTTLNLSVDDHVRDLKGFARWVDSAMSKTINVPQEYPFEDFKNIYLDSYKSGHIKGVTTYRAGTMTTVLSAKEEDDFDEEIILEDYKVPTQSDAQFSVIRAEGKKWYLTTIMNESGKRPIAFFVHTNAHEKSVTTTEAVDVLLDLARTKGIPEKWIADTESKISGDNNTSKIARCISLNLRHGVLIKNVVNALDDVPDVYVGSFLFQIRKYLGTWIKDGEKVDNGACPECGAEDSMIYSEGCQKCSACGWSRC
jgi:ribonucleotide reductase alpha subunit